MSEPKFITAGTKITWTRELSGSDSATYQYILLSDSEKRTIDATYENQSLSVEVLTSDSTAFKAGHYGWYLIETSDGEKSEIDCGRLEIKPDPTAISSADILSHNEKMLRAIRKRLEGRILTDHENYSIEGRSLSRIPFEVLKRLENDYAWRVHREKIARGERQPRKAIRFR